MAVVGGEVALNTHKHYQVPDFIFTTQWDFFFSLIWTCWMWPVCHTGVWHTGHSNHYQEWERCELMFRPLTYVTVLMSLICLLFWSYHYSNPMVQYNHSTQSALWPINHKTELKNPTAGNCATFLHRVLIYLRKKLYERPVRPLCKQVPLFNYWSKKESGKTPGKDTKLQKVPESSNMICVDSLGFAVLRHFCCHSNIM